MQAHHLILGMGKSGQSVARYLTRLGIPFHAADTRNDAELRALWQREFPTCALQMGDLTADFLAGVTTIIVSPGIALDHPFLRMARAKGVTIRGDIDLALHALRLPYVLITGSNGKSTVTALVGALIHALGVKAAVGGNFGTPALDLFAEPADVWVLEVSSFQLESTEFSDLNPNAATVLNISQDHLDRHGDMATYAAIKETVLHRARVAVINRDDPLVAAMATRAGEQVVSFGRDAPPTAQDFGMLEHQGAWWLACGARPILPVAELGIHGQHNYLNALAALALVMGVLADVGASAIDLTDARIVKVLRSFSGLPHRAQTVGTVGGVRFIDDSKATNVGAAVAAIQGLNTPLVLIAGGQGKGQDFAPLADALKGYCVGLVLMGQDQEILAAEVQRTLPALPICRAHSMTQAVEQAAELAMQAASGAIVLLAPACASLDMFDSYIDRGRQFAAAVDALTQASAVGL
ncbi:MAG: UDP-N-acetylmuramoyl-L-alanine--D-glutamate ligase [Halothiobacillus sp.]